MKLCVLIGCHKDFDFVKRIISKLRHKDIDIWLNIDIKADISNIEFKNYYLVKKDSTLNGEIFRKLIQQLTH